ESFQDEWCATQRLMVLRDENGTRRRLPAGLADRKAGRWRCRLGQSGWKLLRWCLASSAALKQPRTIADRRRLAITARARIGRLAGENAFGLVEEDAAEIHPERIRVCRCGERLLF